MFDDKTILADWLSRIASHVFDEYGLDLLQVRCLHTGAVIGGFNDSIFHTALIDEGLLDDSNDGKTLDLETLADSLLVRSLASARPSPALNRPTSQTLLRLLESDPSTVAAYLLNRYKLTHWRKLNHRDDSWFDDMLSRVKVWEKLMFFFHDEDSDAFERSIRALCHWLLELDSKCNLHELTPMTGWFDAFFDIDSIETFELFVNEFALIATPLIVEADKRFAVGNRMASSAYVKSWFDNPTLSERKVEIANRKRQRLHDTYGSVAIGEWVESDKAEARKIKAAVKKAQDSRIIKGRSSRSKAAKLVNKHADILDSLFRSLGEVTDAPKPAATPKPIRSINGLPKFVKG